MENEEKINEIKGNKKKITKKYNIQGLKDYFKVKPIINSLQEAQNVENQNKSINISKGIGLLKL